MPKQGSLHGDLKHIMTMHGVYDKDKLRKCMRIIGGKRKVSASHPWHKFLRATSSDLEAKIPIGSNDDAKQIQSMRWKLASAAYRDTGGKTAGYTEKARSFIRRARPSTYLSVKVR